eukprot:201247-Chlamydomonas_euryale.AAC.3
MAAVSASSIQCRQAGTEAAAVQLSKHMLWPLRWSGTGAAVQSYQHAGRALEHRILPWQKQPRVGAV